jgi:uncharacterized membrane protein
VQPVAGWTRRHTRIIKVVVLVAAAASPIASHIALLTGRGIGIAVAFSVLQAAAVGIIIASIGTRRGVSYLALLASAAMLTVLLLGLLRSAALGLQFAAGVSHGLLYGALLVYFAGTLLPGHTDIVTRVAQRLNPHFHSGMRSYTRRVCIAWCVFFIAQIITSALLFWLAPVRWWLLFINALNVPLVLLMFLGEYAIRRRRFPGRQSTDLAAMIRGFRGSTSPAVAPRTTGARLQDAPPIQAGPQIAVPHYGVSPSDPPH